jgi:hypothetical protein
MSPHLFEVQYDEPFEAIWEWVREEVTANICFGTAAKVREKEDPLFIELAERAAEVMQRCRRELQAWPIHCCCLSVRRL